jgi:uncharacterized protein (DUF433 family)
MFIPVRDPLSTNPQILGGDTVVKGTRIPASLLYELIYRRGYPLEVIEKEYPSLDMQKLLKFRLLIESLNAKKKKA